MGELPGAQLAAERRPPSLAQSPGPGRSRGAPAGVACESSSPIPPAQFGEVRRPPMRRSGRPGSADFFPHRRRETSGEGQSRRAATLGRIGGERAAGVRGKFSSSARRAHVYAYAGLDRGRQAARGRWGLAPEGILLLPSAFGKTLCLGSLAEGRIHPRMVQPRPQTLATKQGFFF